MTSDIRRPLRTNQRCPDVAKIVLATRFLDTRISHNRCSPNDEIGASTHTPPVVSNRCVSPASLAMGTTPSHVSTPVSPARQ